MNVSWLNYARLLRLHQPIGIFLLLWPTLWALWIARAGQPNWRVFLIFCVGTVIMRSAGCVINDLADRKFDAQVARTRARPLVTGVVSPRAAWRLFFGLCAGAGLLALLLSRAVCFMAVGSLFLAVLYPFSKRFTDWPQLVLGLAFASSVPMAFAAQDQPLGASTILLYLSAVLWALSYDTIYALADRADDLKIGVRSTAIRCGHYAPACIGCAQLSLLATLLLLGQQQHFKTAYYLGLSAGASTFLYQHYLLRAGTPQRALRAFRNNHYFGMLIFLGIYFNYVFA